MKRHLTWFLPAMLFVACKRGPEGPAGPPGPAGPAGPAGPNYVPPNQQGYIRGLIIAQDTFNNRRVRENYNYIYYSQTPCDVSHPSYLGPSALKLNIERLGEPYYLTSSSHVTLQIDTSASPPTILGAEAGILHINQLGNILLAYAQSFDINDNQDTLLIDNLAFSPQLTQVRGRLRGIRRSVTPHDTVTFEFESVIPRRYE